MGGVVPVHFQTPSAQWLASWRAQTPLCASYAAPRQHSDSVVRWEWSVNVEFVSKGKIRFLVRKEIINQSTEKQCSKGEEVRWHSKRLE